MRSFDTQIARESSVSVRDLAPLGGSTRNADISDSASDPVLPPVPSEDSVSSEFTESGRQETPAHTEVSA